MFWDVLGKNFGYLEIPFLALIKVKNRYTCTTLVNNCKLNK